MSAGGCLPCAGISDQLAWVAGYPVAACVRIIFVELAVGTGDNYCCFVGFYCLIISTNP